MNFFIIFSMITFLAGLTKATNAPVLMYFKNDQLDNTVIVGQTLKSSDFTAYLENIKSSVDTIFYDGLTATDLRTFLKQQGILSKNINFEPSVESPAKTLTNYLDEHKNLLSNVVTFDSVSKALADFMSKISSSKSDAIILTSSSGTKLSRSKREDKEYSQEAMNVFGINCSAMFTSIYLQDQSLTLQTQLPNYLTVTGSSFTCSKISSQLILNVTANRSILNPPKTPLTGGIMVTQLVFNFVQLSSSLYWGFEIGNDSYAYSSNSSNDTTTKMGIIYYGLPYGMDTPSIFSFACTKTYFQLYNMTEPAQPLLKVYLYIENFQIQPYNVQMNSSNDSTSYTFGQINYCQGFFSNGIWMAITTSLILGIILSVGLSFLLKIKIMDKFDDPKGKPLNIAIEK